MPIAVIIVLALLFGGGCLAALEVWRERLSHNEQRAAVRRRLEEQHSWQSAGTATRLRGISQKIRSSFQRIRVTRPEDGDLDSVEKEQELSTIPADIESCKPHYTAAHNAAAAAPLPIPPMPRQVSIRDTKVRWADVPASEVSARQMPSRRGTAAPPHHSHSDSENATGHAPDYSKEQCPICLEQYAAACRKERGMGHVAEAAVAELVLLPCGHTFHEACIDGWLNENKTCPVCKADIERMANEAALAGLNTLTSSSNHNSSSSTTPSPVGRGVSLSLRTRVLRRILRLSSMAAADRPADPAVVVSASQRNSGYRRWQSL